MEIESPESQAEEPQVVVEGDENLQSGLEDRLVKQKWYLGGDVSEDAVVSILEASESTNCFGVYKVPDKGHMLSAKYHVVDIDGTIFDHLPIEKQNSGKFKISGQVASHEDIPEAVEQFVATFDPPLVPALQGTSFETQISIAEDPPDYDKANKILKPDIAPLPNIATVRVGSVEEAKIGRISPSSSGGFLPYRTRLRNIADHRHSEASQWHYYDDLSCCHPKNVCHGCCYRQKPWNGYRYAYRYKWYDPRGSGPLRVIGLLLFYLFCGLCFGCVKCSCFFCNLCLYVCCGFYDSS